VSTWNQALRVCCENDRHTHLLVGRLAPEVLQHLGDALSQIELGVELSKERCGKGWMERRAARKAWRLAPLGTHTHTRPLCLSTNRPAWLCWSVNTPGCAGL